MTTVNTGSGNDTITTSGGNDDINSGSGNDTINSGAGNDDINAGSGNDFVDAGSGNDEIDAGSGNDTVLAGAGNDEVDAGSGNDIVDGGDGNDEIDGESGDDTLFGGAGDDEISGGSGTDIIYGGSGNDAIGSDDNRCGDGNESGGDTIYGDGRESFTSTALAATLGSDLIYSGSGNDRIYGDNGTNQFGVGIGGNDRIFAGSGNDIVYGEGGNDEIDGEQGDDIVDGGAGNDTLDGGEGKDAVFGGAGNDLISGGDGKDTLHGGSGDDTIGVNDNSRHGDAFENGKDTIFGDGRESYANSNLAAAPGNDTIRSGRGNDLIFGDNGNNLDGSAAGGNDKIYAGSGNDIVHGEGGDDELFGEKGNDTLSGGAGDDRLVGGLNADTLKGGSGNDVFAFSASSNSNGANGDQCGRHGGDHHGQSNWSDSNTGSMDLIVDFKGIKDGVPADELDKIDLTQLLGTTDLNWGGMTPTANGVWFTISGGNTYVYADITGNPSGAELAIKIAGVHNLTNNDFLGVKNIGPAIVAAGTTASGAATEVADNAPGENTTVHAASGTIDFSDPDFGSVHTASFAPQGGGYVGTFALSALNQASTQVGWNFSVPDGALDHLGQGQSVVQTYAVTIDDGAGGTAVQVVTITLNGSNDAPTISAAVSMGAVTEDGLPTTATGTITFDDVDLTDVHSTSVAANGANTLGGVLTASVTDAATGAGDGTVTWNYSVSNGALQYLAAGQTAVEQFTVTIDDGNSGTVSQPITVTVTGTNDAPTISAAVSTGAMTEDSLPTSATGMITFDDVDLTDAHTTSVAADGGNTLGGVLTASVTDTASGAGDGTVTWNYSVSNGALQYLAAGQTAVEQFTVTIDDGNSGTVSQLISITVTGTNDAPTISAAVSSGAVTEDILPTSATGTITFDDVDLTDAHTTSVTATGGNTLGGVLTASVTDAATGAGDGTVTWNYSVANAALQYLAAGQTAVEQFTVTIDDGNTGTVSQVITVTVTGTNDTPTISAAVASGAVTEDSLPTSATGTITFDDVDLSDNHTTSVAADGGNTLGGVLTASVTDVATGSGDGTVTWNYSVTNSALQYLAAGQTAVEQFTVTVDDGNTGTVSQLITVTVTGTNDAPTISTSVSTGAVIEDSLPTTATGTITFDDVDLTDGHTASVAADGGNTLGGVLTASVTDAASGSGDGTVTWNYSVSNGALQYLAAGQIAIEQFTVTIDDGNTGTVSQVITVTVTGTNDAPTISAAVSTGAVTEDSLPTSATGTITFDDVDLTDGHTTSVAADGGNTLGGVLTASVTDVATGSGDGTVTWNYSASNAALQYLAAGQTAVEQFTVTIDDGNTGTASQLITVTVTGTNDAPTISAAASTGAVTEDSLPTSATGTITFDDVDLSDSHTTSVTAAGGNTLGGVLTASVTDVATGSGEGTVTWNYSVSNGALEYLAAGQTAVEQFTVTIDDGNTGTVSQLVTVTVTGTNDAPSISAAASTDAVTEDSLPTSATGTITFDDVDLSDSHTTSVTAAGGNTLGGVLNASVTDAATGAGDGTVTWNYSVSNAALQYLAAGQTAIEQFTVTIDDGNTGTVSQVITVTVTGTNDSPMISAAVSTGAVTEDGLPTSATGTITFDDVDLSDSHTTNVAADGGNALGGVLTASVTDAATGAGDGTVTWNYSVSNAALQYLAAGQTATESFTVTIDDGNTGTVSQLITVTVTGTNDAPTISAAVASGAVAEDSLPTSATGTITFDDLDLSDSHTTSVAAAGGNTLGGVLTASVTDTATGAGDGTVTWNYSVTNGALQYLAAGQTAVEQFTVTIDDANTGTVSQLITVTVTGTNDSPTISAAVAGGAVIEDSLPATATGTITFDDVDLTDAHTTSVAADGSNILGGVLTASVTDAATGAGDGTVTWNYSVANAALQYLAAGQTAVEQFTVTIDDGNTGTVSQLITVTVTGTNDGPAISAAVSTGAVTEDSLPTSATGTITFDDVDLSDGHTTSVTAAGGNALGGVLTASVTEAATGVGDGTVTWNYSVANAALQYLAAGQTAVEQFTVTIDDGNTGTVSQVITVTVTGTNDAPTISAAVSTGAVTEDSLPTTATGTITFDDLDLSDSHTTSVAANGSNTLGGVLTASMTDAASGVGDGTVTWNYSVSNGALQYLAAGQTAVEQFTVSIDDGNTGTASQLITVTVTGTNDVPTISAAVASGAMTEDSLPTSATGTITFDDLDLSDSHTTSVAAGGGNTLGGVLTASITDAATGSGDGTVTWNYSVTNGALQYLAAGQTAVEQFTVTIDDGNAGTVSQLITVTVTGTNDAPTISAAVSTGAVTEDSLPTTATGTITFDDVDLTDAHTTSVTAAGGNTLGGVLTASVTDVATGSGDGTVTWNYSVANAALQYLAAGQTAVEQFTVTIDDGNTGTVSQLITVTVTGTNDAPTISAAVSAGAVTEDSLPTSATGTITFDDVDLTDAHTANVTPAGGNTLGGVLTASVTDTATGAGDGTVTWNYSVANAALQYLAAGQTAVEQFTVTIDDGNIGTVSQLITVTVTGTNDAPTISAAVSVGAVTEDSVPTTATGTITFDDVDLTDAHTTSVVADGGNTLGGVLTASVTDAATGVGDGTVTWNYSVSNDALQYLAAGQTAVEQFTVTIDDGNTGTVSQLVSITVTGNNDAPTISAAVSVGAVTEDSVPTTATGTITFDDVDLTDAHTTSVAADGGNTLGGVLTASVTDVATGAGDGTVTWSYNVANAALQYLASGQTAVEQFTVSIDDGNTGTVSQLITVTVTGTNDAPTISAAVSAGAVTEDSLPTSATGTITFDDVDLTDAHTTSVAADGGNALGGVLTASVTDAATGAGDGTVTWNYSVTNAALQYLAAGQTAVEQFTVTIDDGNTGTVSQVVTVIVTGTNDAPTISAAVSTGAVTEDILPTTATGTITFDDVDLTDAHTTSVAADGGNTLGGVLTASVTDVATGAGDGTVTWNYSVSNGALQYLAAGQTAVEQFTVTIDDGNTGTVSQLITVTVTGTNDAPTISAAVSTGAVTEDSLPTSATGTITVDDLDLSDSHTTSVAADVGNALGGVLTASVTDAAIGAGDGTVTWNYSVTNAALQYLAAGQTAVEQFTVTIDDGNTGTVSQVITVTVTGTNDAPTISAAVSTGAVTEDNLPTSATGTITFDDVDLSDSHNTSVTAAGGNALGGVLTASVTDTATGAGDGTVTWNYSVSNAALQYLAAGQTAVEQFTVTIDDSNTGTVSQLISITVTGTNDAPILNAAASPALSAVAEDAGAPAGAVGTLVSALVNLNPPSGGLDNVTDADAGAVTGMAITAANSANGTWWYSTNNGGAWTQIDPVSNTSALLLAADANTRVYFQGELNFSGTVTNGLTFRAWDQTSGTAGTKVSTATNGGASAFSSATDTASVFVTGVNDNPITTGDVLYVSNSTLVTLPTSVLLANDTDIDGSVLSVSSISVVTGTLGSAVMVNPNGTFSFTTGAAGGTVASPTVVTLSYTLSDGAGGTATGSITLNVLDTTAGANTISLTGVANYQASFIDGKAGGDTLSDGAFQSVLHGSGGNDNLNGNAGSDLLAGGDNNDNLSGGAGNDVLRGGQNNDDIDGGAGTEDLIDFSDATAGTGITFTLTQSGSNTTFNTPGGTNLGNDTYRNIEGVIGTGSADSLTGSSGNDVIRGGAGNDTINGAASIAGSTGDLIDFSDGTAGLSFTLVQGVSLTSFDASVAGLGVDQYQGIEGVIGTNFADTLTGSSSNDSLRGGGGNDSISGGGGNDRVAGGTGADVLTGGTGVDTFVFDTAPNAVDTITDFDASNSVASGDLIELSLATFTALTTTAGNPLSAAELGAADGSGAGDVFAAGVRVIYDSATGSLYYDADGGSSANRTLFADINVTTGTFDQNDIRVGP